MSQVQGSTVAQPIPLKQERYGLAAGITAGIAAAVVAGAFIFSSVTSDPGGVDTTSMKSTGWAGAIRSTIDQGGSAGSADTDGVVRAPMQPDRGGWASGH